MYVHVYMYIAKLFAQITINMCCHRQYHNSYCTYIVRTCIYIYMYMCMYLRLWYFIDSTGTTWLSGMKSICVGSHDHHMTFTALETLLTLLTVAHGGHRPSTWSSCDMRNAVSVLCPDISAITKDTAFIEV